MKVLARKYRPQNLNELRGQTALVRAVGAAISHGRLAQGYILTGTRGVGKTTTARIIARSVNCERGPTLEPCGTCRSCVEIARDSSLDVQELDAASRNGVQDMRELIETISYAPMTPGARKIYIVDEAHMLSTAAWNALLKTLEEPPAHAMFIFATTEPRKIPATVRSRCQKFTLSRIDRETISAHLSDIAGKEGFSLEPGVAQIVAQAAEGSMRDALSILDQAQSSSADRIVRIEEVREMIGHATPKAMIDILASIVSGQPNAAMTRWKQTMHQGIDPLVGIEDISGLLHNTILAGYDPALVTDTGLSEEDAGRLSRIGQAIGQPRLSSAQSLLFEARPTIAAAASRDLAAEIIILRLAHGFARKG